MRVSGDPPPGVPEAKLCPECKHIRIAWYEPRCYRCAMTDEDIAEEEAENEPQFPLV